MRQFIRICLCLILLHCAVTNANESSSSDESNSSDKSSASDESNSSDKSSASDESSTSSEGNCRYPEEFYPPKEWLYSYDAFIPGEDIVKQTFSKGSRTVNSTDEYVCVDSEKDKQTVYTVSSISADGQLRYQCTENIFYDNGMVLQREGNFMSSQPTTEECEESIQQQQWFRVLFEYQETDGAFDVPQMDCPFPQGTFHATLNWDGHEGYCVDSDFLDSTGVVNGRSFDLRLCEEFQSKVYLLVCHQRILATDLGEPDNSNGDIVIASRYYPMAPYRVFYCFRYKVEEGGDKFYIGSVVRTGREIECPKDYTYSTYGPIPGVGYPVAFVLTR